MMMVTMINAYVFVFGGKAFFPCLLRFENGAKFCDRANARTA